jgi:hypothetical protein
MSVLKFIKLKKKISMMLTLKKYKLVDDESLTSFLKSSSPSLTKSALESISHSAIETPLVKNVRDKLEHMNLSNENKVDFSNMTNRQSTAIDFINTVLKTAEFALKNFHSKIVKNG